jgi:hypothetical protein
MGKTTATAALHFSIAKMLRDKSDSLTRRVACTTHAAKQQLPVVFGQHAPQGDYHRNGRAQYRDRNSELWRVPQPGPNQHGIGLAGPALACADIECHV